jgi:DNA polymerase-3 subunit delta
VPISPQQLPARLKQGLSPAYLLAGEEPLLVEECRDQVLAAARADGFTERELLEVDGRFDWDRLGGMASAASLFAPRRIIDLRLPSGKPGTDGAKALGEQLDRADPDLLLMVSCDKWDAGSRKAKWAKAFDSRGTRVDIWKLKAAELPGWIAGRMRAAGLQPDQEAIMALANRLEGNLLAARQEIEKLALLTGGGPISADDVMLSVADSTRFDAFLLMERMLAGNLADALRMTSGLQRSGVAIQMVCGALVFELRNLEAVLHALGSGETEAAVFQRLRIWPARQGAMRAAVRRISPQALAAAFGQLSLIDRQSKGRANGSPWQELDRLAIALCA